MSPKAGQRLCTSPGIECSPVVGTGVPPFFTTFVENKEPSLCIGHYPGTRTRDARGCPLRAWERKGRITPPLPPPSPDPHREGTEYRPPSQAALMVFTGGRPPAPILTLCVTAGGEGRLGAYTRCTIRRRLHLGDMPLTPRGGAPRRH